MEPTLSQIEDYKSSNISNEKKKIINMVIAGLLALGIGYTMIKVSVDSNMPIEFIPFQIK
ncbi:MAG: hypothetical protein U9Q04_06115 [Campylobacterota bacterium]|nr:hypothetical protein [Campylobacterota bacterium]